MFTESLRKYDGKCEPEWVGAMNIFLPVYLLLRQRMFSRQHWKREWREWVQTAEADCFSMPLSTKSCVVKFCINYSEKPWQKAKVSVQSVVTENIAFKISSHEKLESAWTGQRGASLVMPYPPTSISHSGSRGRTAHLPQISSNFSSPFENEGKRRKWGPQFPILPAVGRDLSRLLCIR